METASGISVLPYYYITDYSRRPIPYPIRWGTRDRLRGMETRESSYPLRFYYQTIRRRNETQDPSGKSNPKNKVTDRRPVPYPIRWGDYQRETGNGWREEETGRLSEREGNG